MLPGMGPGMPPGGAMPPGGMPPGGGGLPSGIDPQMLMQLLPLLLQMLQGGGAGAGAPPMPGGPMPGGPPMPGGAPGGPGAAPFSDWLRTKGVEPPM